MHHFSDTASSANAVLPLLLWHAAVLHRCGLLLSSSMVWQSQSWAVQKNSWADQDAAWDVDFGGSKEPHIRWGSRSPHAKMQFLGKRTCLGMPNDNLPRAMQKWLNRSRCHHLGCGLGWDQGGGHTGATWRIPLHRPCAAVMRPFCQITLTSCLFNCYQCGATRRHMLPIAISL